MTDKTPTPVSGIDGSSAEPSEADLWAIHVAGPDDIYAMPSREEASTQAKIFNSASITGAIVVTVVPWPYTAEAHAKNMLENME